jgi:hypothetical protein
VNGKGNPSGLRKAGRVAKPAPRSERRRTRSAPVDETFAIRAPISPTKQSCSQSREVTDHLELAGRPGATATLTVLLML